LKLGKPGGVVLWLLGVTSVQVGQRIVAAANDVLVRVHVWRLRSSGICRPAGRPGLEFVEKVLTDSVVALLDRADCEHAPPASVGGDSAGLVGHDDAEGMSGRVGVDT